MRMYMNIYVYITYINMTNIYVHICIHICMHIHTLSLILRVLRIRIIIIIKKNSAEIPDVEEIL